MANLQALVHESLDNAMENGYFEPGMSLHGLSNEELAGDMLDYDATFGNLDVEIEDLVPHIQTWWQKL